MKHFDSHTTSQTKTSLLKGSKITVQVQTTITVFIEHQLKRTPLTLPLTSHTINELIHQALEEYNLMFGTHLSILTQKWELYACKKNNRAYSDYPSLEPNQKVEQTGFSYFYLCHERQFSGSSSSCSSKIKTEFDYFQKKEIKQK